MVVFLHALDPFEADNALLPNAGLSVDFFFVLSGFVIAYSYEKRFADGLGIIEFIQLRLIRLYPMIALGLIIGFTVYAIKIVTQQRPDLWMPVLGSVLLNAFLMPSPWLTNDAHGTAWPIDLPLWSLSFEFAINLIYAVLLVKLTGWRLWVAVSVGLLWSAWAVGSNGNTGGGPQWETLRQGWVRVYFPFVLGVLLAYLYRRSHRKVVRPWQSAGPFCMLILFATLVFPIPEPWTGWYGLAVVAGLFPVLVWIAARFESGKSNAVLSLLGELSYPLYALHYPIVKVCSNTLRRFGVSSDHPTFYLWIVTEVSLCVALAAAAWVWIDKPTRAWLTPWTKKNRSHINQFSIHEKSNDFLCSNRS